VLGVLTPPGEFVVRVGGSKQSRECVGAGSGGAACVRARLDAVKEKEMVQLLDIVQAESSYDACCIESCIGDEFVGGVGAEGEEGGKAGNGEGVGGTSAAHDDGENVDSGARPMLSNSIG
jgi:hypothetical protein